MSSEIRQTRHRFRGSAGARRPDENAPRDETLTMANGDGTVKLELTRRWVAQGVGESAIRSSVLELEV